MLTAPVPREGDRRRFATWLARTPAPPNPRPTQRWIRSRSSACAIAESEGTKTAVHQPPDLAFVSALYSHPLARSSAAIFFKSGSGSSTNLRRSKYRWRRIPPLDFFRNSVSSHSSQMNHWWFRARSQPRLCARSTVATTRFASSSIRGSPSCTTTLLLSMSTSQTTRLAMRPIARTAFRSYTPRYLAGP